ncbi:replication protein [Escherichia coli]|nr:replication protein [Escherichia coli]
MFIWYLVNFLVDSLTTFGHRLAASGVSSRIYLTIKILSISVEPLESR